MLTLLPFFSLPQVNTKCLARRVEVTVDMWIEGKRGMDYSQTFDLQLVNMMRVDQDDFPWLIDLHIYQAKVNFF